MNNMDEFIRRQSEYQYLLKKYGPLHPMTEEQLKKEYEEHVKELSRIGQENLRKEELKYKLITAAGIMSSVLLLLIIAANIYRAFSG